MYDNKGYVVTVDIMHSDTHTHTDISLLPHKFAPALGSKHITAGNYGD